MRKSNVIYKTEDGYLTNGVKLLENISNEIEGYLINQKLNLDGQDFFPKYETEIGNEFLVLSFLSEINNFFLVDQEHRSIDTNLKIIVEFSMKLRESIVE
jgi:hypothetical protein